MGPFSLEVIGFGAIGPSKSLDAPVGPCVCWETMSKARSPKTKPSPLAPFLPIALGVIILALVGLLIAEGDSSKSIESLEKRATGLEADVQTLKSDLETKVSALRSDLTVATQSLDASAKKLAELEKAGTATKEEVSAQKTELAKAKADLESARKQVQSVVGALSGLGGAK